MVFWELLHEPLDNTPLIHNEWVHSSRFLPARHLNALQLPASPELRAVVAVASPKAAAEI